MTPAVLAVAALLAGPAGRAASAPVPAPAGAEPDACRLLADEDVRAVQGQEVVERLASAPAARVFRVAQCVYRTPDLIRSVSVAVTSALPGQPPGALRTYWKERFTSGPPPASRKKDPPRPVPGLGDDAFWVGDPRTGSLYVLKGDTFLRISLGGVPDEGQRLDRTKVLASSALRRLAHP